MKQGYFSGAIICAATSAILLVLASFTDATSGQTKSEGECNMRCNSENGYISPDREDPVPVSVPILSEAEACSCKSNEAAIIGVLIQNNLDFEAYLKESEKGATHGVKWLNDHGIKIIFQRDDDKPKKMGSQADAPKPKPILKYPSRKGMLKNTHSIPVEKFQEECNAENGYIYEAPKTIVPITVPGMDNHGTKSICALNIRPLIKFIKGKRLDPVAFFKWHFKAACAGRMWLSRNKITVKYKPLSKGTQASKESAKNKEASCSLPQQSKGSSTKGKQKKKVSFPPREVSSIHYFSSESSEAPSGTGSPPQTKNQK